MPLALNAIGAGLGLAVEQIQKQREQQALNALRQLALQQAQQQQQGDAIAMQAALSGGLGGGPQLQNLPGLGSGPTPPMPGQSPQPQAPLGGGGYLRRLPPSGGSTIGAGGDRGLDIDPSTGQRMDPTTHIPPQVSDEERQRFFADPRSRGPGDWSAANGGGSGSSAPAGASPSASAGSDDYTDYITQGAIRRGLPPRDALHTVDTEGGRRGFKLGDSGTSGGPFQLHTRGSAPGTRVAGLGDDFRRDTGLDPLDPKNVYAGIDYALDAAAKQGGFSPQIWHGLKTAMPPPVRNAVDQTTIGVASKVPSAMYGTIDLSTMARAVHQVDPSAPLAVQWMALGSLQKMMAPQAQQQFDILMQTHRDEFQERLRMLTEQHSDQAAERTRTFEREQQERGFAHQDKSQEATTAREGWSIEHDVDGTAYRYNKISGEARTLAGNQPYTPKGAVSEKGVSGTSKELEVKDKDGNVVFHNLAHRTPTGWVSDKDNTPVPDPPDGEQSIKTPGAGGRLQQMTLRLELGANQVAKAVTAMASLPASTTLGLFGGAQAALGEDLGENVKKALANKATPEASQILRALSRGVSRGLATLESGGAAQGLVGLAKQMEADLPEANDTGLTIASKYADIRQIVEAAQEVLDKQNIPGKEKDLLKGIVQQVQKAVPYTVQDVVRVQADPSDENIAQFAQRVGLTGGEQGSGSKTSTGVQWSIVPQQ